MPVVTDYTALLSGDSWNGIEVSGKPVIVTYSFPTSATPYMADVGGFTAATVASFQAFGNAEQAEAQAALGEWAAASGLIFVQVAPGKGDINFQLVDFDTTSGPSYSGAGGIGFYPFGNWDFSTYPSFSGDLDASGDVFMNSQFVSGGEVNYGTLLHEIGHAIGLKHPTEVVTDFAANPVVVHDQVLSADDPSLTIMAEVGDTSGAPDHLRTLDQQAAAFLYGPAGPGEVVTGNASGANAALSSWSWNSKSQVLTENGFAGDDTMRGSSVSDIVNGLDGDDKLFGLSGNDVLNGGAGDDMLNGGPGHDTMTGGVGDDTYAVDNGGDKVIEQAGEGFDSVLATVSYTLPNDVELLQLFGGGLTGKGNALANTMFGDGSLGDRLYGLAGDDYMVGGSANDTLDGGTGADTMFGGAGNDTYFVDNAGDMVREDSSAGVDDGGTDTVDSSITYTLPAFVEKLVLTGTAAIDGTGNDLANQLTGNAGVNHLYGMGGNDILTASGGGADFLYGGEGSDTYYVDNSDTVMDTGTAGTDTINVTGGYTLATGDGIENLTIKAGTTNTATLTGNELANRLTGNDGDNTLRGLAGNDILSGGLGNDKLQGGLGRDTLTGGAGSDTFIFNVGDSPSTASPLGFDTLNDFTTGVDRIDLDIITGAGIADSAYAEVAIGSNGFPAVLSAATSAMADGHHSVVFVAGSTDGWLLWNTDGDPHTPDQAVRLVGQNSLADFAKSDLM